MEYESKYPVLIPIDRSPIVNPLSGIYQPIKVRRCNWCYNIIKNEDGEEVTGPDRWCSPDCKQEEEDWNFINKLTKARETSRRIWKEKHPVRKKSPNGTIKDRKEYDKKYFEEHRDKKREQAKLAMRKKRLLDKMKK